MDGGRRDAGAPGMPYAAIFWTDSPDPCSRPRASAGTTNRIPGRFYMTFARVVVVFAAAMISLTVSCREVDVTAVDAAVIVITPTDTSVHVDEVTRLTARVLSSDGDVLSGRTIVWTSMQPELADVSDAGEVIGIAPGIATIRAASEGTSATAEVTVTPEPAGIAITPSQLEFTALRGGSNPAARNVAITNTGVAPLDSLTIVVNYPGGQPAGFVSTNLSSTTAPATLAVSIATGSLATGTYTATVHVGSPVATNSPQVVSVTFDVAEPPPAIAAAPTSASFATTRAGADPPSVQLAITNGGGAALTGLSHTVVYGTGQPSGWLTAALSATSAPATLTLSAAKGTLGIGTYTATVRLASGVADNSPFDVGVTFAIAESPPAAASALTAAPASEQRIDLAWTDNSTNESGFTIERSHGSGDWTEIGSTDVDQVAFVDSVGLAPSTAYFHRVLACNSAGCSDAAGPTSATTAPAPPSDLGATVVSATRVDLAWTDNSTDESEFRVERSTEGGDWTPIHTSAPDATSFSDATATPETSYRYRARACRMAMCSAPGNIANATTGIAPPGAPSALHATTISTSQIDLSWAAGTGAVDEYRIERRIGSTGSFADHDTVAAGSLAYQDTGLAANTQYFYRIEACNTGGCSAFSSTVQATTLPDPPGAPSGLQAEPVDGSPTTIDLQWTASTGTVTEYRIERRLGAAGEFVDRDIVAGTTLSYRDTGLTAATQYVYRVEACNSGGCSSTFSNEASATTNPNPPGTPADLEVSAVDSSSSAIDLTWMAPTGVVDEYEIERRTATGSFTPVTAVPDGTLTHEDTGLTASTQYFYRVRACNAGGCSSYGDEASASTHPTAPGTPSILAAAPVTGSSSAIDLVWSPAVGAVIEYRIERRTGTEAFAPVDTAPAGTTSYQDIGLTAGTLYVYRVAACNAGGCSSFTNEAEATTNP